VWAAIPNSFSRWSIKQQTFSKSPRLELIPHFIHPKDNYRRNLEPMNVPQVFQLKKNSKKIERRKEKEHWWRRIMFALN
jgi:hypothetical protein